MWAIGLVSVAAVIAAFAVGPRNGDQPKGAANGSRSTTTSTTPPASDLTTAPRVTPPVTAPVTTATSSSVPPTIAPPTTAPTTAAPTTAAPTTEPAPVPPVVMVSSCRIDQGTTVVATGTVTNRGNGPTAFRTHTVLLDGAGQPIADVTATVSQVPPGATAAWTATKDLGPAAAGGLTNCRANGADPLPS